MSYTQEDVWLSLVAKSESWLGGDGVACCFWRKFWAVSSSEANGSLLLLVGQYKGFPNYCKVVTCKPGPDKDNIRQNLENLVAKNDPPFPSLEETARIIKCSTVYIKKHFPDLAKSISRKHLNFTDTIGLKAYLEDFAQSNENPPPSLTNISQRLGYEIKTLRRYYPELCKLIVERHRRWSNKEETAAYLQLLMEDNEYPFPSVVQVSKRIGRSTSYLRDNFPAYCKQISSNYYRDREQAKLNRVQQRCEEIRQVMFALHAEGIYPSRFRVESALKKIGSLFLPETSDTWRKTLQELNTNKSCK